MSMDVSCYILEPLDKNTGYDRAKVYDCIGLNRAYGFTEEDKYHIKLKFRSEYASMDDIKEYVQQLHPEWDMTCWSMHNTNIGVDDTFITVSCNGETEFIKSARKAGLVKEHISEDMYCLVMWEHYGLHVDDARGIYDDLKGIVQDYQYVTDELLEQMTQRWNEILAGKDIETLASDLEDVLEFDRHNLADLIMVLKQVKVYADKCGGAAVLCFS